LGEWEAFKSEFLQLTSGINAQERAAPPFALLSITGELSILRKAAEIYSHDRHPVRANPKWSGRRYGHEKIRVAYLSCDFKVHPAALNNMLIWEKHDRDRFEVVAFSYGPVFQEDATPQGQMRSRLVKAFDKFLDVGDKSDEQIAQLMSEMEIDIAVDLSGLTNGGRQGILAYRPAPVQVNFYGFTSGAPYIDYIISDRVTIPPEHQHGYTEKVVYLPDTCLGVDTSRQVSSRQFTRGELGLPEGGVVYCSFNTVYKINPQMFDVWMRILLRVPGSVLWLQGGSHEKVKENLRREAQARGVEPDRLVFAARMESMAEHLARHRAADVFLDTLPFNAQTTAADALWAGLPVLTCLGESSFGRVAGSLLMALGMPELVTKDVQAYEAMAVGLGTDAEMVKRLKEKLRQQSQSAPLFDMERYTRHLERAYEQMHQYVQQGKAAQAIEVVPHEINKARSSVSKVESITNKDINSENQITKKFNQAIALHQKGSLALAKIMYEEIIKKEPKNSDAIHYLGVIAHQTNNYEEAIKLIRDAIEINDKNPDYHYNLGLCYKKINKYAEAELSLKKARKLLFKRAALGTSKGKPIYKIKKSMDELGIPF
jgi:predicted O-linked N-acetylglucosamine transferase (SPINDLY family)